MSPILQRALFVLIKQQALPATLSFTGKASEEASTHFVSEEIEFSSVAQSCPTLYPREPLTACQASLSITNSRSLPKLMSVESVMPSSHLILCCPLLLLPPIPRSIRVFSNESTLHMRWPKYWSSSFSISPSNEHPGLVSFRMDWLDLLPVQGTLQSEETIHLLFSLFCQWLAHGSA